MVAVFAKGPPRGRPFQKGREKTAGRKVGVPNIHSRSVRESILEAYRRIGSVDRLIEWIKESPVNEYAWWTTLWPRLLPLQVHGEVDVNVRLSPEELMRKLAERNLPLDVFGADVPTESEMKLIDQSKQIEHVSVTNGHDGIDGADA
jgi:hypothetical protein